MATINQLLDAPRVELEALTDEELLKLSYGIEHFQFSEWFPRSDARVSNMALLDKRLAEAKARKEAAREPRKTPRLVMCDCGHEVPANLVMHASRGRVCPDCYDEWSD
jgi:hypothetical protein